MDSWGVWKVMCVSILSVEDAEDIYTFGFMITGFLLFGAGGFLVYRKIRALLAATGKLPDFCAGVCRAMNNQTVALQELNRKLDAILAQNAKLAAVPELVCGVDTNLEKLSAWLGGN